MKEAPYFSIKQNPSLRLFSTARLGIFCILRKAFGRVHFSILYALNRSSPILLFRFQCTSERDRSNCTGPLFLPLFSWNFLNPFSTEAGNAVENILRNQIFCRYKKGYHNPLSLLPGYRKHKSQGICPKLPLPVEWMRVRMDISMECFFGYFRPVQCHLPFGQIWKGLLQISLAFLPETGGINSRAYVQNFSCRLNECMFVLTSPLYAPLDISIRSNSVNRFARLDWRIVLE